MEDFLNLSQANDLERKGERIFYRLLEILPGFFSWATLILAIILSFLAPVLVAIFIILFDFYWLLKVFYLSFHQISTFLQMKRNLKINWLEKLKNFKNWQEIYHLIILPVYKEGEEIIEDTLNSLFLADYPKEKLIVILSIEEKAKNLKEILEKMREKFSNKFFKFLITIHPKNLEGEIAGRGSNSAWALKEAKKIIENLKIPFENILVSIFDADTKPFPQYFSCLTFHYLKNKKIKSSFQPIPIYNNNIWSAPAFSRVVATSGSFWQMMQQERPESLVSYSSHSLPFSVLNEVGYPKNVIPDDSRIFWKAFLYYNGNYKVIPLFYPVSMDAVLAKNLFSTIVNQYKQQRRWAWGCTDIPYLIFGFFKNKKIPIFKKIQKSILIFEGFWSWAIASLLIFLLGWLPLILGSQKFNVTILAYNLPRLTRNLMTLAMIGMIVSAILSFLILPPKPKNQSKFKYFSMVLQWILLPFTLIFFGSLPALEAQTRLIFGNYLEFWSTEKRR